MRRMRNEPKCLMSESLTFRFLALVWPSDPVSNYCNKTFKFCDGLNLIWVPSGLGVY